MTFKYIFLIESKIQNITIQDFFIQIRNNLAKLPKNKNSNCGISNDLQYDTITIQYVSMTSQPKIQSILALSQPE